MPHSMGLLDSNIHRVSNCLDYSAICLPILSRILHTSSHAFFFFPLISSLFSSCSLLFLQLLLDVITSFSSCYTRWVKLPYNLPTMTLPTSCAASKFVGRGSTPSFIFTPPSHSTNPHSFFVSYQHFYHHPWPTDVVPMCLVLSLGHRYSCF